MLKRATALLLCAFLFVAACAALGRAQQRPTLVVQTGFSAYVSALALSYDGKLLAAGGWDKTIQLWDVGTRREIYSFTGHSFWVSSLAFSKDGRLLASCGDNKVRVWDVASRAEVFTAEVGEEDVKAVVLSPDGGLLAGGGSEGHVFIWSLRTRGLVREVKVVNPPVNAVAFSPNGDLLASGSRAGVIDFWSAADGSQRGSLADESRREIHSLAFSPDGSLLAAGVERLSFLQESTVVTLWDVKARTAVRRLNGPEGTINSVAFSRDGGRLAGASSDMSIFLREVGSDAPPRKLKGHFGDVTGVAFGPDGDWLASSSGDMTVRLWDASDGHEVAKLEGYASGVNSVAVSPDGKLLASGNGGIIRLGKGVTNTVKVWDLEAGRLVYTLKGAAGFVTSVSFDRAGRRLAAGGGDGKVMVWDVPSGRVLRTLDLSASGTGSERTSVAFSPDGTLLAAAGEEKVIKLWRASDWKLLKVLRGHGSPVNAIAFRRDGRRLASASGGITGSAVGDDRVKIWDVNSGVALRTLSGHKNPVTAVAFSDDGATLASGSGDATVKLWRADTGELLRTIQNTSTVPNIQGSAAVNALAFAAGGRLVSGGDDGSINFWDVGRGALLRGWQGHITDVTALALTPDKKTLVSGGGDGFIKFWDPAGYNLISSVGALGDDGWASVGPEGQFDTNLLESPEGIHWVLPSLKTSPLPLEIFMRDYYEPRLLTRKLGGEQLRPVRDLSLLNRAQPTVEITGVSAPDADGKVRVTVAARSTTDESQHDDPGRPLESGVYDLRLFRDGQLVGYTTPAGAAAATRGLPDSAADKAALAAWRAANGVALEGGKFERTFDVRLPRLEGLSEVEFTAYAFNSDRVKSETARYSYKPQAPLAKVKGRAYVITVGASAYEEASWDLSFAAADASLTRNALAKNLSASGAYSEVVPVTLTSERAGGVVTEGLATKENFRALLEALARGPNDGALKGIPGAETLRRAEPEDIVVVFFSGHGYTDRQGKYYLVPYNTGAVSFTPGSKELTPETLSRFVSSDELSEWVRDIDAGEFVLVVDTCHSAGAVEEPGFKPGPMGSRGMGQLAYDKGMRVLAASQADDVALEVGRLRQGLLTYALVREGLEGTKADANSDGDITLDEWLAYGVERVPALYEDVRDGKLKELKRKDVEITGLLAGASVQKHAYQLPQLFDFKRKRRDVLLSVAHERVGGRQ